MTRLRQLRTLCLAAFLHAIAPLSLLMLQRPLNFGDRLGIVAPVLLYATWPFWLLVLIPNRHESPPAFWWTLGLSSAALALVSPAILFLAMILGGAKT